MPRKSTQLKPPEAVDLEAVEREMRHLRKELSREQDALTEARGKVLTFEGRVKGFRKRLDELQRMKSSAGPAGWW